MLLQPKDYTIKMNKKERRLALSTALQSAAEAITVVEDLKVTHMPHPTRANQVSRAELHAVLRVTLRSDLCNSDIQLKKLEQSSTQP